MLLGHDSNNCNRCFDIIKANRKTATDLFIPDDWLGIISKTDPTCTITRMTNNEFYSVEQLMPIISKENAAVSAQKIDWSKIESLLINRGDPLKISIGNSIDGHDPDTFAISNLPQIVFQNANLIYSNKDGNAIPKYKYDGLQNISKYIPSEHQDYYKSLKYNEKMPNEDFALVSQFYEVTNDTFYLSKT